MGLRSLLAGVAVGAPVPVFAVVGRGGRTVASTLRLNPRLRFVDTPRAANVLLVAGGMAHALLRPALAVHDQLSRPRCTIWWPLGGRTYGLARRFPPMIVLDQYSDGDRVVETVVRVHSELLRGRRTSDPPVSPDVDPAPWRGVGPYGQGGKGMTGGVPYGRPLAGRAPGRDGLELDQVRLRVGPFFPAFPPGLVLDVKVQGDLIQEVSVGENPFSGGGLPARRRAEDVFHTALETPASIAALELARARHHLRWLAHALRAHGLAALGVRALGLARDLSPQSVGAVRNLHRMLERTGAFGWATAGVGVLAPAAARTAGGPVARAAGVPDDARMDDPGYHALGFEPVIHEAGDARARWRQRLAEAIQALELATRARDRRSTPTGRVESAHGPRTPAGSSSHRLLELLPGLLPGMDWGDAVTAVVSLDLDLEDAT